MSQLILSTFSGIGLLDKAFRGRGFVVVSAGDIIYGQDIREFRGIKGRFDGVIGGSPCQDYSGLKRNKGTYSDEMIEEYIRVVKECNPAWWLLENVKGVPDIKIDGYSHQRIDINQGWYSEVSRLRHIQFGSKNNLFLNIPRLQMKNINSGCALASDSRSFKELCYLQGLPSNFDLPDFNVVGKKKAVGNGVPLVIGKVLAEAVAEVTQLNSPSGSQIGGGKPIKKESLPLCPCGCKRPLVGRKKYYDSACRKRAERKRKKGIL
jgi:DNA (cytosine-5)-methyltransferase 1